MTHARSLAEARRAGVRARLQTVDVDDGESAEGDARPARQLAAHQVDDLVDLTVALAQVLLHTHTHTGATHGRGSTPEYLSVSFLAACS